MVLRHPATARVASMHPEAHDYIATQVAELGLDQPGVRVLDLGGRDVNGTTRDLFTAPARYVVVDIAEHPSVDIVADASELDLDEQFDVVTSTECFEHTPLGSMIVDAAYRHLVDGGWFLATMAGPGRLPHGADGAWSPAPGEWYENIHPIVLDVWLNDAGFVYRDIDQSGLDLRCKAQK